MQQPSKITHQAKPGRPALPPRPYPPSASANAFPFRPLISTNTNSISSLASRPPPTTTTTTTTVCAPPSSANAIVGPSQSVTEAVAAIERLSLRSSPPCVSAPEPPVAEAACLPTPAVASDLADLPLVDQQVTENSTALDDAEVEEADVDDDVSSTIAVRGSAHPDWHPADAVPSSTTATPTYLAVLQALPEQQQQLQQQSPQLLNDSLTSATSTLAPDGYDDDDDVRIFECEHNNGNSNRNEPGNIGNDGRQTFNSFTLTRFLQHDPVAQSPSPSALEADNRPQSQAQAPTQLNAHQQPQPPQQQQQPQHPNHPPAAQTARKLYELSQSPATCIALRQSRAIPLCVQIIHSASADAATRRAARRALHNMVNTAPTTPPSADADRRARSEIRLLRHIDHVLDYCDSLQLMLYDREAPADDRDRHPLAAMSALMKISFDEEHRATMCQLGALQAIASVVQYDHAMHGAGGAGAGAGGGGADSRPDERCVALRRFAAMALTNLTFGDDGNKAALCANKPFMRSLVGQLAAAGGGGGGGGGTGVVADDLLPVTANVLRNLSWRADARAKRVLSDCGTIRALTAAAMRTAHNETTLKALLSALWNLSAHSSGNKAEFCAIGGAIAFVVDMLRYEGPSRTWTVVENAGGILRNVSSHVAVNAAYRAELRARRGLAVLLEQLAADSVTVVSNACGTLWNLSARCAEDQHWLLANGARERLGRLVRSKHKQIANGAAAALKNLLNCGMGDGRGRSMEGATSAAAVAAVGQGRVQSTTVGLQQQAAGGASDDDEMLPPLRVTQRTAQLLQSSYLQTQRKFYPPPPPPPPRRPQLGQRGPMKPQQQQQLMPSPPTPPRRNLNLHQQQQQQQHLQHQQVQRHHQNHHPHQQQQLNPDEPYQETDLDQITDFSLRYGGDGDALNKTTPPRPMRSQPAAASASTAAPPVPPTRRLVLEASGAAAPNCSGIATPEQCTKYAEEGTPGMYESYSSLEGSLDGDKGQRGDEVDADDAGSGGSGHCDDEEVPVTYRHTDEEEYERNGAQQQRGSHHQQQLAANVMDAEAADSADADEGRDQFPPLLLQPDSSAPSGRTTPGGGSAKGLGAYDTPMMFSRHSSLGSLSSLETPQLIGDDGQSVISDFSRLASRAISPSEIPDSPSQMMPDLSPPRRSSMTFQHHQQQQQQHHHHHQQYHPLGSLQPHSQPAEPDVFDDHLRPFGVENTPAHMSSATSLSYISIADSDSAAVRMFDTITNSMRHPLPQPHQQSPPAVEAMRLSPDDIDNDANDGDHHCDDDDDDDDDDSAADDGDDGDLLAACINMGMKKSNNLPALAAATDGIGSSWPRPTISQNPSQPTPSGQLSPLFADSDDDAMLSAPAPQLQPPATIETPASEVANCPSLSNSSSSDSLASNVTGQQAESLLELCIQSGMHKRPASAASTTVMPSMLPVSTQEQATESQVNYDLSSDDDDDEDDGNAGDLLATCINIGMKKMAQPVAQQPQPEPMRLNGVDLPDDCASDISTDGCSTSGDDRSTDDPEDVRRLQQCIQQGMTRRADGASAPTPYGLSSAAVVAETEKPKVDDGLPVASEPMLSDTDSSASDSDGSDSGLAILQQAIAIGSKGAVAAPATPTKSNGVTAVSGAAVSAAKDNEAYVFSSSSASTSDDDDDGASAGQRRAAPLNSTILAQCIQMGMHKRPTVPSGLDQPQPSPFQLPTAAPARQSRPADRFATAATGATGRSRSSHQPTAAAATKSTAQIERERHMERERQKQRDQQRAMGDRDDALLSQCIQLGMGGRNGGGAHHAAQYQSYHQHSSLPYQPQQQQPQQLHQSSLPVSPSSWAPTPMSASGFSYQHHSHSLHHSSMQAHLSCSCPSSGRFRCAVHGGGGSMRRRRDDPLPPIPLDGGGGALMPQHQQQAHRKLQLQQQQQQQQTLQLQQLQQQQQQLNRVKKRSSSSSVGRSQLQPVSSHPAQQLQAPLSGQADRKWI